jgi:hypothetical protein
MRHRIVSTRLPISAHPNHTYKFIENLENHRQIHPGVSDWVGDKDTARYRLRLGPWHYQMETRIVEKAVGMRICEETIGGSPITFRRWYKIQADEHTCIAEISMECEMTAVQRILLTPLLKKQLEGILKNLKAVMEKPKEAAKPVPTPASIPPA